MGIHECARFMVIPLIKETMTFSTHKHEDVGTLKFLLGLEDVNIICMYTYDPDPSDLEIFDQPDQFLYRILIRPARNLHIFPMIYILGPNTFLVLNR